MPFYLRLNYTLKTEEERKANNRTELMDRREAASIKPKEDELVFLGDHRFQRNEMKAYDMMDN